MKVCIEINLVYVVSMNDYLLARALPHDEPMQRVRRLLHEIIAVGNEVVKARSVLKGESDEYEEHDDTQDADRYGLYGMPDQ